MAYSATIPTGASPLRIAGRVSFALLRSHRAMLTLSAITSTFPIIAPTITDGSHKSLWLLSALMWVFTFSSLAHEAAHAFIVAFSAGISSVRVEALPWRTSVTAEGSCRQIRLIEAAIAGPCAGVSIAFVAWIIYPSTLWLIVAIPHICALLPFSGDGRALIQLMRKSSESSPA